MLQTPVQAKVGAAQDNLLPQIEDPIAAAPVAGAAPWSSRRRLRPGRCRIPRAWPWASIGWVAALAVSSSEHFVEQLVGGASSGFLDSWGGALPLISCAEAVHRPVAWGNRF